MAHYQTVPAVQVAFQREMFVLQDRLDDIALLADIAHSFVDSMTTSAEENPAKDGLEIVGVGQHDLDRALWCHKILAHWIGDCQEKHHAALRMIEGLPIVQSV